MFEQRSSFQVPANHPCLAGHFPGNPIVPAVVLLQAVLDAAQRGRSEPQRLRKLTSAKFLLPLLPGESCEIVLKESGARLDWRCERGAQVLASGSCEIPGAEI